MPGLPLLILLLLQGGSPEPSDAPGLRPADHDGWSSPSAGLAALEADLVGTLHRVRPSLVQVRVRAQAPGPDHEDAGARPLLLSGVVLAEVDGGALVVVPGNWNADTAPSLTIHDLDGRSLEGSAVRVASELGLSLLRVPDLMVEAPVFGEPEMMPLGSVVLLLGNAYGLYGNCSLGMLTGRGRSIAGYHDLLQVSNPVNPGDGGGMLVDRRGRLVGLAFDSLAGAVERSERAGMPVESAAGLARAQGISLAIPIDQVVDAFREELGVGAPPARWVLGVQLREAAVPRDLRRSWDLRQRSALRALRVEPGLPAAAGGMQAGDLLVELDGQPLQSFACLFHGLQASDQAGHRLGVVRDGALIRFEVSLVRMPLGALRGRIQPVDESEDGARRPRAQASPPPAKGDDGG